MSVYKCLDSNGRHDKELFTVPTFLQKHLFTEAPRKGGRRLVFTLYFSGTFEFSLSLGIFSFIYLFNANGVI